MLFYSSFLLLDVILIDEVQGKLNLFQGDLGPQPGTIRVHYLFGFENSWLVDQGLVLEFDASTPIFGCFHLSRQHLCYVGHPLLFFAPPKFIVPLVVGGRRQRHC